MISAEFFVSDDVFLGFRVEGHSGYAESGSDIVCASVSSAAILTANTLSEVFGLRADVRTDDDGYIKFIVLENSDSADKTLRGLHMFLEGLSLQYSDYLGVSCKDFVRD